MKNKLSEILKESLSHYHDFHDMDINEHEWVTTEFTHLGKSVSFRLYEASKEEIENLGKKYSLTIEENDLNDNRIFRMVRGNNAKECLTTYFELINYDPSLVKKEFDSIELIYKETCWSGNSQENIYTALNDNASIFITYTHGKYQRWGFKKRQNFKVEENFIIFDETVLKELPV